MLTELILLHLPATYQTNHVLTARRLIAGSLLFNYLNMKTN